MLLIQCMCQAVLYVYLFIQNADSEIVLKTSRSLYSVGDQVILKCIIDNRHWITASILRDDELIVMCNLRPPSCGRTLASKPNYSYNMISGAPTVTIENVTIDDNDVPFKCKWLESESVVSFHVNNSEIVFETSRSWYSVGDQVVLKCIIDNRHWITASILRDDELIAMCNPPPSSCGRTSASKPNYSYNMISGAPTVTIENVTIDDNDVPFKCKWLESESVVSFRVYNKSATNDKAQHEIDAMRYKDTKVIRYSEHNLPVNDADVNSGVMIQHSLNCAAFVLCLFFSLS